MSDRLLKNLGEKLQEARKKSGLTQDQVAKVLGINKVQLSYYETGAREINLTLLQELAGLYGYSVGYFLGNEQGQEPEVEIAFRADEFCKEDLETVAFAKTFLRNLCEMRALLGR
ncbi:HTH-type transcriptional regulator ImmR [Thermincola ferriacetica]|uniref:HTH-type transcriptional regulator ImmR n=1 Tax=Thermincola ferriacetica TaxID=281456 RepID=A0A0L6VZJ6_9FIRM|nr:helix-turn-helix transcriptional regulator [Thermincola ferriacetica]KNZ68631.1 HTH-type transcriptional regulator ImmR [Thermincola ferriacetica]